MSQTDFRAIFAQLDGQCFDDYEEFLDAVLKIFNTHLAEFPPGYHYDRSIEWAVKNEWVHNAGNTFFVSMPPPHEERSHRLARLLIEWRRSTREKKALKDIVSGAHYETIVKSYGREAIPWILRAYNKDPDFSWICLLVDIIGQPAVSKSCGRILSPLLPILLAQEQTEETSRGE